MSRKSFVDHMKSLPKDWIIVGDPEIERSDVPMSGSWKTRATIRLPANGGLLYAYQYGITGARTYMLMTYSRAPDEPLEFTRFAKSFSVISSNVNTQPPNVSGIFILWAVWGAIVDWRYIRRGGLNPSRNDKLSVLAAIGLCIGAMVLLGVLGATAEAEGRLASMGVTVVFGLWEFSRWRVRRKNPLPTPSFLDTKPEKGILYTESEQEAMKSR